MLVGLVEGTAISTIKHRSMTGWKLLIVQPLTEQGGPDGDPVLVVDSLGAGRGCKVVISNDGKAARQLVGDNQSPVRWTTLGILDE